MLASYMMYVTFHTLLTILVNVDAFFVIVWANTNTHCCNDAKMPVLFVVNVFPRSVAS